MSSSPDPPGRGDRGAARRRSPSGDRRAASTSTCAAAPAGAQRRRSSGPEQAARTAGYAEGWAQGQRAAAVAAQAAARPDGRAAEQAARAAPRGRVAQRARRRARRGPPTDLERQRVPTAARRLQDAILRAAVELAEAILGRELATAEGRGAGRRCAGRWRSRPTAGPVTVRLHPDDHRTPGRRRDRRPTYTYRRPAGHPAAPTRRCARATRSPRAASTTVDATLAARGGPGPGGARPDDRHRLPSVLDRPARSAARPLVGRPGHRRGRPAGHRRRASTPGSATCVQHRRAAPDAGARRGRPRSTATGCACLPLGPLAGIGAGSPVVSTGGPLRVPVGDGLRGRILDGLGRPMDGGPPLRGCDWVGVDAAPPSALERQLVDRADVARRARARHARAVRPRPAHRHLRRLRRRQVHACCR